MIDDLGDRMKAYEGTETKRAFDKSLPIYCRIDGRGFSKFTKGLDKPFSEEMTQCMIQTAEFVRERTKARIAYVQSDEISLFWQAETEESQIIFGGRIQKLVSITASLATVAFNEAVQSYLPEKYWEKYAHFDSRVFQLPDEDELTNAFLWRYKDCFRNAIQGIAQVHIGKKKLHGVSIKEQITMLDDIGMPYESFPRKNIHGTFLVMGESWNLAFDKVDHETRKSIIIYSKEI